MTALTEREDASPPIGEPRSTETRRGFGHRTKSQLDRTTERVVSAATKLQAAAFQSFVD